MPHNDNTNDDTGETQCSRVEFFSVVPFSSSKKCSEYGHFFQFSTSFFFSLFSFVFGIFNAGNACGILATRSIELLWFLPSSAAEPWSVTRTAEGLII